MQGGNRVRWHRHLVDQFVVNIEEPECDFEAIIYRFGLELLHELGLPVEALENGVTYLTIPFTYNTYFPNWVGP